MPKLKNYTAPLAGSTIQGGRRATAEEFGGAVATATRTFGQAAQSAGEQILTLKENEEARSALVASAEIRAKYSRLLDEAAQTGADTEKLKEQMNNEMAAVGNDFATNSGRAALDVNTANANLMFDEQANAIQVKRAAAEAKLKGNEWLNAASAQLARDPTTLKMMEQDAGAFVDTFTNLPPEKKALIKQNLTQQLNMSAALAVARTSPDEAESRLTAGDWDLSPAQRQQALKEASFSKRAARAEEAAARALKRQEEAAANQAAMNEGVTAIINGEPPDVSDPRLTAAARENLLRFQEWRTKELTSGAERSTPSVKRDLWLRVNADDTDPQKITTTEPIIEAVAKGQLNTADADHLVGMLQANRDGQGSTFRQRLGARLSNISRAMYSSPEYSVRPELASSIQNELLARAEDAANQLREKGKDPGAMLDPDSGDYFFKPGLLQSVAEDVKKQSTSAIDLRVAGEDAALSIPNGMQFIDPNGVLRVMTQELHDKLVGARSGGQQRYPVPPEPGAEGG